MYLIERGGIECREGKNIAKKTKWPATPAVSKA
jgi:hypothetical protein